MNFATLIGVSAATAAETFQHVRDFVCKRNGTYDYSTTGIGWDIVDASYAVDENTLTDGDWVVIKSPGESGRESLYYRLEYDPTYPIYIRGYLYWDAATHSGAVGTAQAGTLYQTMSDGSRILYIHGDLDEVLVMQDGGLVGSARAEAPGWEWPDGPGRLARAQHRL
jgi:hypothetical protein